MFGNCKLQIDPFADLLSVFENDSFERVADVFAAVDGVFNEIVEFFPLHDFEGIDVALKQA